MIVWTVDIFSLSLKTGNCDITEPSKVHYGNIFWSGISAALSRWGTMLGFLQFSSLCIILHPPLIAHFIASLVPEASGFTVTACESREANAAH